jgi:hypothetical protein
MLKNFLQLSNFVFFLFLCIMRKIKFICNYLDIRLIGGVKMSFFLNRIYFKGFIPLKDNIFIRLPTYLNN